MNAPTLRDIEMSHDSCTCGTSRVLTIASLQLLKMKALNPAPEDCEVRSVIKFLYSQSMAPIEIRQLCQQSFSAPCRTKLSRSTCSENSAPGGYQSNMTPEHKAKHMESTLTIVVHLFLHLKKFLYGPRQRFQVDSWR